MTLSLPDARRLWEPTAPYLDTASVGLPPTPAWETLQQTLADWRAGRTFWEGWQDSTDRARQTFARLVGVDADRVAIGPAVSPLVGLVAASAADGTRVLAPEIDFTSLLFPWLVHADRGIDVRTVPLARLAEAIDERTDVVAFSAVQSSTGEVADLDAIAAAAAEYGARTVVDATHAVGWLPLHAARFDAVVCAGYKWLLAPRGTAYLVVGPELLDSVRPLHAGWFAGENVHDSYYGPPLRLARSARRLDVSPAWFSWIGAAPALEVLEAVGIDAIHEHDVALANRFRSGLGLPPGDSAIVTADVDAAEEKLATAGIKAVTRAGALRASFHLYTSEADVDAALDALLG